MLVLRRPIKIQTLLNYLDPYLLDWKIAKYSLILLYLWLLYYIKYYISHHY